MNNSKDITSFFHQLKYLLEPLRVLGGCFLDQMHSYARVTNKGFFVTRERKRKWASEWVNERERMQETAVQTLPACGVPLIMRNTNSRWYNCNTVTSPQRRGLMNKQEVSQEHPEDLWLWIPHVSILRPALCSLSLTHTHTHTHTHTR